MSTKQPFRTRITSLEQVGGVWVAHLATCNRCRCDGQPTALHTFVLPGELDPAGGEVEVEAPCNTPRQPSELRKQLNLRRYYDGGRMSLVYTPAQVADAERSKLPKQVAKPHGINTVSKIMRGDHK